MSISPHSRFCCKPATKVLCAALAAYSVLALSACSPQTAQQAATTQYQCGAMDVTTNLDEQNLTLSFGTQRFELEKTESTSGERYVNANLGAEFWHKGNEAQFSTDKFALPLCIEQGTLPQQLSARGNEPFWLLSITSDAATLRTPGAERRLSLANRATLNDAPPYQYELSFDAGAQLTLSEGVCYDTMSGQSFPYSAEFSDGTEDWTGCAGDPQRLLTGVSWKDSSATENVATMTFAPETRVSGFAGCNYFTGNYTITGEGIDFSSFAMTKRMCPPEQMDYEDRLMQQLTQVTNFKVFADGTLRLQLRNGDYLSFTRHPFDLFAD